MVVVLGSALVLKIPVENGAVPEGKYKLEEEFP